MFDYYVILVFVVIDAVYDILYVDKVNGKQ